LALLFMLHLPLSSGTVKAYEIVTFIVPVIPAYALVPLIAVAGSVTWGVDHAHERA